MMKNAAILFGVFLLTTAGICADAASAARFNPSPVIPRRIEILPHDNLERLGEISFCGAIGIGIDPPPVSGQFRSEMREQNHFATLLFNDFRIYIT